MTPTQSEPRRATIPGPPKAPSGPHRGLPRPSCTPRGRHARLATDPQVGLAVGYAVAQECTRATAVREYKRFAQTGGDGGRGAQLPRAYRPHGSTLSKRRRCTHSSVVTDQMSHLESARLFLRAFKVQERDSRVSAVLREGSAGRREHERTLMGTEVSRPHETSAPRNGGSGTKAAAATC